MHKCTNEDIQCSAVFSFFVENYGCEIFCMNPINLIANLSHNIIIIIIIEHWNQVHA